MNREQRRRYNKERKKIRKKLEKKAKNGKLDVLFTDETVTSSALFIFIESFKKAIQLQEMIKKHITMKRYHNAIYPYDVLIDQLIDALIIGYYRYSHVNELKFDPGYKVIKGGVTVSDESTIRKAFKNMTEEQIIEFNKLNSELVVLLLSLFPSQSVWLNADDTVITVHGEQEKAEKGYNPKYPGRKSYKAKVTTIGDLDFVLNIALYGGKTASNGNFLEFLQNSLDAMHSLKSIVIEGIRLDKGFFDQKTFQLLEELNIFYVCKVPLQENIKKMIGYLDEMNNWTPISDSEYYDSAELTVPLPTWEKARRFIFIRKKELVMDEDSLFPGLVLEYRYEVIVTNILEDTPEEIWHRYNKRADVENRIDELKEGFALDKASQKRFKSNTFFTIIKTIAYNLLQGFKLLLPQSMRHYEAPRLRREFINKPGNVYSNRKKIYITLPKIAALEKTITILKRKFNIFLDKLASIKTIALVM